MKGDYIGIISMLWIATIAISIKLGKWIQKQNDTE